jgi:hypothetical protein
MFFTLGRKTDRNSSFGRKAHSVGKRHNLSVFKVIRFTGLLAYDKGVHYPFVLTVMNHRFPYKEEHSLFRTGRMRRATR